MRRMLRTFFKEYIMHSNTAWKLETIVWMEIESLLSPHYTNSKLYYQCKLVILSLHPAKFQSSLPSDNFCYHSMHYFLLIGREPAT